MSVKILTHNDFDSEVLKSKKPVLVDFFATWCMPCKMLAPVLENVSDMVGDSAKVVKLDIDQNMPLAIQYGVMSVPTMVVVKGGKEVDRIIGFRQPNQIVEVLKKHQ